jgi:hypothetical protein
MGFSEFFSDVWYCSVECRLLSGSDGVFDYARSITYHGLLQLVYHSSVRNGDGRSMMDDWCFNMWAFNNFNHPHYVKITHNMLIGK